MRLEYTEYPFIFKGTSKIKAALRRAQREGGLKNYYSDVKGIIELIKAVYGDYYWSTTMQADQTAGRYKTINRDSSNAKEVDEDSLTAQKMGILFDDDDVRYNVNKFLHKEVPVLWVTGMSGGGKTTLANQICDKTDADLVGIDEIIHYIKFMLTGSSIGMTKEDFDRATKMDKNYKLAHDYVKKHPDMNPYDYNHLATIIEAIVKRYKLPHQIVIEGVQIPYICMQNEKLFSTNCAIIIKGTSILTSVIRRYKRDQDAGWFINEFSDIKRYFDMYRRWYKSQNEFRQFVTPNTESWADEKAIIDSMNDKDRDYTCGPACARTLVHYYTGYIDETEQDVATIMGTNINTGTTIDGMVRYFKDHLGWKVNNSMMEGSPSTYEDFKLFLDYNLSHGMCIMVENKAFGGHWRIIVGFNEDTDTLTMVDPYNKVGTGVTIVNARDFFTTWYDTNLGSYKAWVTAKPNE
jgi:uridine kinase